MGWISDLKGTFLNLLGVGGTAGFNLKNNSAVAEIRNAGDSAFVPIRALEIQSGAGDNDLPTLLDLDGRVATISFDYDGASPPGAGSNTGLFGFVHTTGGARTAGDIVYDNGSALVLMPTEVAKHITTTTAVTGTISLIANGFYALVSGSWVLKGDQSGTNAGQVMMIQIPVVFGDTTVDSTTSVPSGSKVVKTVVRVDTLFDGTTPTLLVAIQGSSPATVMSTAQNDIATADQYETNAVVDIGATETGLVRATLTPDGSAAGAAIVQVYYSTPTV